MKQKAQGLLVRLIEAIADRGLPSAGAMRAQLIDIHVLMRAEADEVATDIFGATSSITVPAEDPAYAKLRHVLGEAYDQAAVGKGRDRHVKHEAQPFEHQPICSLQRIYGSGYAFGQVGKKMEESMRMDTKAAVAELYGAINYIAAAIIVLEEEDRGTTNK